jgi:hypothetical protein
MIGMEATLIARPGLTADASKKDFAGARYGAEDERAVV